MSSSYAAFFENTFGQAPRDWQRSLSLEDAPRSRLIRIPTGLGKTLGALGAWSWHRLERADERWPRRLVWCLPMRVLVEQTEAVVRDALARQGRLWDGSSAHAGKVGVHVLMGGADAGGDWELFPEECAVLIGTQDMLLSRALNRGYAAGRARWPLEFGLLSHDALWVMDEVQLMDVGLATSAQLQAYQDEDAPKGMRPRHSWWMSATLQPTWLKTVDTAAQHDAWARSPCVVPSAERADGLGAIRKSLTTTTVAPDHTKTFAALSLDAHRRLADGEHGRITLVVCNTVKRASETFDALRGLAPEQDLRLVHSRFRPSERAEWRTEFLTKERCTPGVDRVIVATQVVEAGVDISAGAVITDLAPWPSLVQRFGRCARYGGMGAVTVVDRGRDENTAPYDPPDLEAAWQALETLTKSGGDVGTASLETFEEALDTDGRQTLFPYQPKHLLLRREFVDLFDTTPDLTGADLDISRFIRSGEERDLQVFWLDVPKGEKKNKARAPDRSRSPSREELCSVPFLQARDWLCGLETKSNRKPRLLASKRAWVWDWLDGDWVVAERAMLTPGRVVCVAATSGGYRLDRGFDPDSTDAVSLFAPPALAMDAQARERADASEDDEALCVPPPNAPEWKTIACHGGEVAELAQRVATAVGLSPMIASTLALAGRWHDLGKAHPAWQGAIRLDTRPDRQDLAKAPDRAFPKRPKTYRTLDDRDVRAGLRHELASALALFAVLRRHAPEHPALLGPFVEALRLTGATMPQPTADAAPTPSEQAVLACSADEFDLLAYLVLCHHGKVRASLHAGPKDQDYRDRGDGRGLPIRGVREGDVLPPITLDTSSTPLPSLTLTLEPASLGLSAATGRSWRERTIGLLDRFGPGALAWLEALIIAADRRASKLSTSDPALAARGGK